MSIRRALALVAIATVGCASLSSTDPVVSPKREVPRPADKPQIVIAVTIDQLGSWVLDRHLSRLDADGAIRTAIAQGTYHHRVAYPYAPTYTAPGHAAIHTGAAPYQSEILSNERFDPERGEVAWVDDAAYPLLGDEKHSASPRVLAVPTVGDALKTATAGRALVLSVSLKDRAAVLSGGKHADLALFYDSSIPGFTTSKYYAKERPPCVTQSERAQPLDTLLAPWTAPKNVSGLDAQEGEGSWKGWTASFPHDPRESSAPYSVIKATPAMTDWMVELASTCADDMGLGKDDVPDLLALSISGTDYAGHVFGPESWEYVDNLVRADRAVGRLIRHFQRRARVSVLITSDHGVTPLPETSLAEGRPGGRLMPKELVASLNAAVSDRLGAGEWVTAFVAPFVTLAPAAEKRRSEVVEAVVEAARALPGVYGAFDVLDAAPLRQSRDPIERAVGLSIDARPPGDVYLVPSPGFVVDPDLAVGQGTSHGGPWATDREVPVLFFGAGVEKSVSHETQDALSTAATIAALLAVPAPSGVALPGVSAP